MKYFDELSNLTDSQLLRMRICDLPISFETSQFSNCLDELHRELEKKKIKFRPKVWISDDWFCPDGITAFALPFFLMHPRLIELEKKMIGHAEGSNNDWFMKLMRHECGHAIDNAYFLRECDERRILFGDCEQKYPESYTAKKYSKKFVQHLEDSYAQAHPEEDWAESFAVWLTPNSSWRKRYETWPAIEKLNYIQRRMKVLKNEKPNVICYQSVDHFEMMDISLRSYYNNKVQRLKGSSSHHHLRSFLSHKSYSQSEELYEQLKENRKTLKKNVATRTRQYQYKIESALTDLEDLARNKGLKIHKRGSQKKKLEGLEGLVETHAKKFFKEGKHRIIM